MKITKNEKELQTIIKQSVNNIVDFVKPTYGPANNNIILNVNNGVYALDDGVSISSVFSTEDPIENTIYDLIRDVAGKTSKRVKDGTTTSLLLLQGIMNSEINEDIETIKKGAEEAKEKLLKSAKEITTLEELKTVARIAYNNPVADDIASTVYEVGKNGSITVESSNGLEVEYSIVDGMKIDAGYVSPHMVTDYGKFESVLENTNILVTDTKINDHNGIAKLMAKIIDYGSRELLIISEGIEGDALSFVVVNKLEGKFKTTAIDNPMHGNRKTELLMDICALTGADIVSDLKEIKMSSLGFAEKVISSNNSTLIIKGKENEIKMQERESYYGSAIENEESAIEKERLSKALANLRGGIGVIKVGANTSKEIDNMIPKIENVKNSVMSAYKHGVVKGSGLALRELTTCSKVLNEALQLPYKTICINMGVNESSYYVPYNFITEEEGDEMEVGVIDSVEVLMAAIDSAVSVACLLLKAKGIYVDKQ